MLRRRQKTVPSSGKIVVTIFWGLHGIIFIEYLERGRQSQFPVQYCVSLLGQFHGGEENNLFAPRQCRLLVHALLPWSKFSNYDTKCSFGHLIPLQLENIKKWLGGKRIRIAETDANFVVWDERSWEILRSSKRNVLLCVHLPVWKTANFHFKVTALSNSHHY